MASCALRSNANHWIAQIGVAQRNLPLGAVDPRVATLCHIAARERVCREA